MGGRGKDGINFSSKEWVEKFLTGGAGAFSILSVDLQFNLLGCNLFYSFYNIF